MHDLTKLTKLGKEHKRIAARMEELRPELVEEIRAAAHAGVSQTEIIGLSGYTRNTVRLASMSPEERDAENAKRRKATTDE